jgi:hypothetical protein
VELIIASRYEEMPIYEVEGNGEPFIIKQKKIKAVKPVQLNLFG